MSSIATDTIVDFLKRLGEKCEKPATLLLLGGGALNLLGSPRLTGDIDYVGSDLVQDNMQRLINQIALELNVEAEPVPFYKFVPFDDLAEERQIWVGKFGQLDVRIVDPYAIVLSKLERGFDTDLGDVVFLINQGFVTLDVLEPYAEWAFQKSSEFDLDVDSIRRNLADVRRLI